MKREEIYRKLDELNWSCVSGHYPDLESKNDEELELFYKLIKNMNDAAMEALGESNN